MNLLSVPRQVCTLKAECNLMHPALGEKNEGGSLFLTAVARVLTFLVLVPPTQILTGYHKEGQIIVVHTVGYNR